MFPSRPTTARNITGEETRAALIDAATEVFLDAGCKAARVQDIAARAGVRLSAINYHFGGKEGLYLAVLRHHAELAIARNPLQPPEPGLPLRARFEYIVRSLVGRMLDPANPSRLGALMMREALNPTPALDVMFETFTRPQSEIMIGVLREMLGPETPPDTLSKAILSVFGQVAVYRAMRPLVERVRPSFYQDPAALEDLVRHVTDFSWAGLQAMARQLKEPLA